MLRGFKNALLDMEFLSTKPTLRLYKVSWWRYERFERINMRSITAMINVSTTQQSSAHSHRVPHQNVLAQI